MLEIISADCRRNKDITSNYLPSFVYLFTVFLFLAPDDAGWITGVILPGYGGVSLTSASR